MQRMYLSAHMHVVVYMSMHTRKMNVLLFIWKKKKN